MIKTITSFKKRKGGPPKKLVSRTDKKGRGCQRQNVRDDKGKKRIRSKKLVEYDIKNKWRNENPEEVDEKAEVIERNVIDVEENYKQKRGHPKKVVNENDNTEKSCAKHTFNTKKRRSIMEEVKGSLTQVEENTEEMIGSHNRIEENSEEVEGNVNKRKYKVKQVYKNETNQQTEDSAEEIKENDKKLKDNYKEEDTKAVKENIKQIEENVEEVNTNHKNKMSLETKEINKNQVSVEQNADEEIVNGKLIDKEICKQVRGSPKKKYKKHKRYSTDCDIEDSEESDTEPEEMKGEDEAKFVCCTCRDDVKMTAKDLRAHVKTVHKRKSVQYFKLHKDNRPHCEICSKELITDKRLKKHLESHSNDFICESCGMYFKKLIEYTLHLRLHNSEEMFDCVLCDFKTDSINDITTHVNTLHSDNCEYMCKKCGKKFYTLSWLKEHEDYHKRRKPFKCNHCLKTFSYSHYLFAHKNRKHKQHEENTYYCVICRKKYGSKHRMEEHMYNEHAGNRVICDICGLTFKGNDNLNLHLRIHTGYKPFTCNNCGKCFTRSQGLVTHMRTHTGEKPYTCEICSKGFSQRSSLVIHIRGHTGEKPFSCHICNKAFAARSLLNVHLKNGSCVVK